MIGLEVLADMKRKYSQSDFENVVHFLKPAITIASNVCGFPTKTEADFEGTLSIWKRYKFPNLFVNQFFPILSPCTLKPLIPADQVKKS